MLDVGIAAVAVVLGLGVILLVIRRSKNVHALARAGFRHRLATVLDAHPELVNARDRAGETPVHHAAKYGELETLRLVVERGGDVNAKCEGGGTPLHMAAWFGYANAVEYLLAHGAVPDVKADDGVTPIQMATVAGHDDVARLLAEALPQGSGRPSEQEPGEHEDRPRTADA